MMPTTMYRIALLFTFATGLFLLAQTPPSHQTDTIAAAGGDLRITPIQHASLMLEFGGKVIYADPVSQGANYTGLPQADLILTDVHGDHLDAAMVNKLKKSSTIIVAPGAVAKTISEAQVIGNGEKKSVAGIEIEAVPMYNMTRGPQPGQFFHDKGRGNGYILILRRKRTYLSGDTECIPEMKALRNIDVAFFYMNLPYTMPPSEAAECAKNFRPKIVYPYHFRGSDPQEFANALKGVPAWRFASANGTRNEFRIPVRTPAGMPARAPRQRAWRI